MNFLFLHQNFPGQYKHIARLLAANPRHSVKFITQEKEVKIGGVEKLVYAPNRKPTENLHRYLREMEKAVLNGQEVVRTCLKLNKQGWRPDIAIGHNGWGELLYLKDIWPDVPILGYFEFFYRSKGSDVGFDPAEQAPSIDDGPRLRTLNTVNLLGVNAVDAGMSPTEWQKAQYPKRYHDLIHVIHDGIDTEIVKPNPDVTLKLTDGQMLGVKNEIVTYVARNLEPYRGFHIFMRALPEILKRRPQAQVLIVGGDGVSYGKRLPDGETYKQRMLNEVGQDLDMARVHFLGKLPYNLFLSVLQASTVHVYLTYPFVLSWSLMESMAAECLIVGSDTAPLKEVIRDGRNGLLTDFFDVKGLVRKVTHALENRERLVPLRKAARQTILEQYDLNTVCLPKQLQLIESLTGRKLGALPAG